MRKTPKQKMITRSFSPALIKAKGELEKQLIKINFGAFMISYTNKGGESLTVCLKREPKKELPSLLNGFPIKYVINQEMFV